MTSPRVCAGIVLVLQATCAFASREGEALVQPVLRIIWTVLVTSVTLVIGGSSLGAFRAGKSGESILMGGARGLLKGFVTFVVVVAVSVGTLTVLGMLWVAYSLLYVYVLNPSSSVREGLAMLDCPRGKRPSR